MNKANDGEERPNDGRNDAIENNAYGLSAKEQEMQPNDTIENKQDTASDWEDPDNPLHDIKRWFGFLRDPANSQAIIAALTIVIAITGIIYCGFSILQWCANEKAANAAKGAADTASKQLEMMDRPWIQDNVRSGANLIFDNGTLSWSVTIRIENVGHAVASVVVPRTKLIAANGADIIDGPVQQAHDLCKEMSTRMDDVKPNYGILGGSEFPGNWLDFPGQATIWATEVKSSSIDGGTELGRCILPLLVGCIVYRYETSETTHHTGFVYMLSHKDDSKINAAAQTFFSIGKAIPQEKIVLTKTWEFAN